MKSENPVPKDDLEALLERGRVIRPVSDVVRARALARARVTVTEAATRAPAEEGSATSRIASLPPSRRRRGWGMAVAASVTLAVGAAGAGAALRAWTPTPEQLEPAPRPTPHPVSRARVAPPDIVIPPAPAMLEPAPVRKPRRLARVVTAQESYRAELDLLQRAQVAYAGHDFSGALVLVAEHARRFPGGRLAEEREALRIRALAASGRTDEARRAVASFAFRFPRSVLLPRLQQATTGAD